MNHPECVGPDRQDPFTKLVSIGDSPDKKFRIYWLLKKAENSDPDLRLRIDKSFGQKNSILREKGNNITSQKLPGNSFNCSAENHGMKIFNRFFPSLFQEYLYSRIFKRFHLNEPFNLQVMKINSEMLYTKSMRCIA